MRSRTRVSPSLTHFSLHVCLCLSFVVLALARSLARSFALPSFFVRSLPSLSLSSYIYGEHIMGEEYTMVQGFLKMARCVDTVYTGVDDESYGDAKPPLPPLPTP